jgi:hypothetical protein
MDTLRYAERLQAIGIDKEQATGMAKALNEELKEATVTKADLAVVVAELRGEISRAKTEMIVWQIGIGLALFGALKFLH